MRDLIYYAVVAGEQITVNGNIYVHWYDCITD